MNYSTGLLRDRLNSRNIRGGIFISTLGACSIFLLASCSTSAYYSQAVKGHFKLYSKRKPIDKLLENADTSDDLKKKLFTVKKIRRFASRELKLPDNGSFTGYVELERRYLAWSVVAVPEFSLSPKKWCFPVAGCVSYRGYFNREDADAFARSLHDEGFDVSVLPISAYSTLGWFDDPVLSTFLSWPEQNLAGLIFHELTHAMIYVKDDSVFNESLATVVEREGVIRWVKSNGNNAQLNAYNDYQKRKTMFTDNVMKYRERLKIVYDSGASPEEMREQKKIIFDDMLMEYKRESMREGSRSEYREMFYKDLNNAKIASVFTYYDLVPTFKALLDSKNGNLDEFYAEARNIGSLPKDMREQRLNRILPAGNQIHSTK